MEITDPAEARLYWEQLVRHSIRFGKTREEAEQLERGNLAYYAGYYDHETRVRVERLFGCEHPFFGKASNGEPSPEEAFRMGQELGEALRKTGTKRLDNPSLMAMMTDAKMALALERVAKDMPIDDILDGLCNEGSTMQ